MAPSLTVTPLSQLDRTAPEAGRIKLGHKTTAASGKTVQASLHKFRFTSPQKNLLDQLAAIYGGLVKPWHDDLANPRDQFELYSETDSIKVLVIPGAISQWYELWSKGGNERRCDGEECTTSRRGPNGPELTVVPCICNAEEQLACKRTTRIQFALPEISFAGVWRLETKGKAASRELPAMFDLISAVTVRGRLVEARLIISERTEMRNGKRQNYVVPQLVMDNTLTELGGGASTLAIGPGEPAAPTMELGTGLELPDDGIEEAEVLTPEMVDTEQRLAADAVNFGFDPRHYIACVRAQVNGDYERMRACSDKVRGGTLVPLAISQGKIQWEVAAS
jgi:hypothetical protein